MIRVKVVVPQLDRLEKEFKYLKQNKVVIGFFGDKSDEKPEGTTTIAEYAFFLNEGTVRMKPKPFFTESVETKEAQAAMYEKFQTLLSLMIDGQLTGKQVLLQLGAYAQQKIKDKIMNNSYENDEQTIKYKERNKNNTLRHQDFMLNAVTYQIMQKGEEV